MKYSTIFAAIYISLFTAEGYVSSEWHLFVCSMLTASPVKTHFQTIFVLDFRAGYRTNAKVTYAQDGCDGL